MPEPMPPDSQLFLRFSYLFSNLEITELFLLSLMASPTKSQYFELPEIEKKLKEHERTEDVICLRSSFVTLLPNLTTDTSGKPILDSKGARLKAVITDQLSLSLVSDHRGQNDVHID